MGIAKKSKEPMDLGDLLSKARAAIEAHDVVKITSLGPKEVRAEVLRALTTDGFEATKSVVRRPVAAQLLAAFAEGAYIPVKSLASVVRGATAAEAKRAATVLVQKGELGLVLRGNAEVLVPSAAAVLTRDEMLATRKALEAVSKTMARAAKHRGKASLLRGDVLDVLRGALRDLSRRDESSELPAKRSNGTRGGESALERVMAALDASRDDRVGMSFVPHIVERLRTEMEGDAIREALSDAAARGVIELRPEGGLGRLTREELDACVPGPQGTRLSWARRVDGGS